jgi:hypothetical protein
MIDLLFPVAVFGAGLGIGVLARDDADEGCNGHHWGEPVPFSESEDAPPWKTCNYREATVGMDDVVMEEKAIKECQDCGETRAVTTEVGRVPVAAFDGTRSSDPTSHFSIDMAVTMHDPEMLHARLLAIDGVETVTVRQS